MKMIEVSSFAVLRDDVSAIVEVREERLTDVRESLDGSRLIGESNTHRGKSSNRSYSNEYNSSTCRVHGKT